MNSHLVLTELLHWANVPERAENLLDDGYFIISIIPANVSTHREIWYYRKDEVSE